MPSVTHEKAAERSAHDGAVLGVCTPGQSAGILCSYSKTEAFVWRGGHLKKLFQLRLNSSAHIIKVCPIVDEAGSLRNFTACRDYEEKKSDKRGHADFAKGYCSLKGLTRL